MSKAPWFPLLLLGVLGLLLWGGDKLPAPTDDNRFAYDPPTGSYQRPIRVSLRPARHGDTIIYATGGAIPTATVGTIYHAPLALDAEPPAVITLRAREFGNGDEATIHNATYVLGLRHTLPVLALAADPAALWDVNRGLMIHPGEKREIVTYAALIEGDGPAMFAVNAGLRVRDNGSDKPDFRLYFRRRYGNARLESPLFPQAGGESLQRLEIEGGGLTGRGDLLATELTAQTSDALGLPTTSARPALLFVNGEPWGVYLLRERLDRFYLREHLGFNKADLVRDGHADEGNATAWRAMLAELSALDPTTAQFPRAASAYLDEDGLMDAVLLTEAMGQGQILAVRERRTGARWQWLIAPQATMSPDDAVLRLHRLLLQNDAYRARFAQRAAAHLAGDLSPGRLLAAYDDLAAAVRPDIAWELTRWPFPPAAQPDDPRAAWEAGVAEYRAALQARLAQLQAQYPASPSVPRSPRETSPFQPNDVIINEYWIADNGTPYASLGGRGIVGDWIELRTRRSHLDLRGWRLTDNDRKTTTAEGSLIFPALPTLADVPRGTLILIVATENLTNTRAFPSDDLNPEDGRLLFYVGNGHLDRNRDPGFALERHNEALVLLAPGHSDDWADDVGVDFVAEGSSVTPRSFGVAEDGVRFRDPFQGLGRDDGAIFTGEGSNDDGRVGWIVAPAPELTGDTHGAANILTPGAPNEGQGSPEASRWLLLALGSSVLLLSLLAGKKSARDKR